ncbi:hypothetical protein BMS3Bbin04_01941 [bacterium BMS3Bbin04]|nr:hypothetical protein BMS3Bbin04_01941 [bacterium BMS3Bbin04]
MLYLATEIGDFFLRAQSLQILHVKLNAPEEGFQLVRQTAATHLKTVVTGAKSVKQCEQRDFLTSLLKLIGHLPGNHSSARKSSQQIRSVFLCGTNPLQVILRHLRDIIEWFILAIQTTGLQSVQRLFFRNKRNQFAILQNIPTNRMGEEQRCTFARDSHGNE